MGVAIAAVALALWAPWKNPAQAQGVRFEVGPPEKTTLTQGAYMTVSPDGRWMVFPATGDDGRTRYYVRKLDETIGDFPGFLNGAGWNADGVIVVVSPAPRSPIYRISAAGGKATPLTALAPNETFHNWPQFLPDGKHFLYQRVSSDAAKAKARREYRRTASGWPTRRMSRGAKSLVLKGGGALPLWGPDGKELFYRNSSGQIMVVDVDAGKGFQAGTPRRLFASPPFRGAATPLAAAPRDWDISPDGKRFLFVAPRTAGRTIPFTVVLNWAAGLK